MTLLGLFTLWGVLALASAAAAGALAWIKNRDYSFWMGWAFIVPVIPIVVLLFLPRLKGPRPRQPTIDELESAQEREW